MGWAGVRVRIWGRVHEESIGENKPLNWRVKSEAGVTKSLTIRVRVMASRFPV